MNILSTFRNACFTGVVALCALFSVACEKDKTTDGDPRIYYPEVANIGPSMSFISSTPTFYGFAPTNFAIVSITHEGASFTSESFSIHAESGVVTISNTAELTTGLYKLTIGCQSNGANHTFSDVFVVRMVAATPVEITVSEGLLSIPYAEIGSSKASVQVTAVGESVSITGYALVQPEGFEYFSISTSGLVMVNSAYKGEKLPGIYELPIRLTTPAGSMVYENLLTAKITSQPLAASYTPAAGRMEFDRTFQSATPSMKGSPEQVVWAIRQVTPATDKISIDPATGVLSVAADNGLEVDAQYGIDLQVTNSYGVADFDGAFTLTVIDFIAPIDPAMFAYAAVEAIQGGEFTAEKSAGFVGDEVVFSFGTLPAELAGQLSIDAETGAVSAKKGHKMAVGLYSVPVKATNIKGEQTAQLALTIKENPYYFTTITFGNNLGLSPAASYANQFHAATATDLTAMSLVPTTNAKAGTVLSWSIKMKHQCSGSTIDEYTGEIKPSGFSANNGGMILVTATAGEGQVGETTVTVPLFFSFLGTVNGVTLRYTPFVIQVNPRKGITSAAPTFSGVESAKLLMDYRRTFNYYNIGGPATHLDGQPAVANSFMNQMWAAYNAQPAITKPAGTGSKDPLSYFMNEKLGNLNLAMLYVDKTSKSIVVNPNKWVDSNGVAANGAMLGQITFVTNGDESGINNGGQMFPAWIWFDEKF